MQNKPVRSARRAHEDRCPGRPLRQRRDEFGDACAYLCSKQAGYITGHEFPDRQVERIREPSDEGPAET